MGVIFMPTHLIWQILQFAHIRILIMHFQTGHFYCGAVTTIHVSIFLANKQIKSTKRQKPRLGFTFITSLDVVLLMVELHLKTKKYVICVNKNLH